VGCPSFGSYSAETLDQLHLLGTFCLQFFDCRPLLFMLRHIVKRAIYIHSSHHDFALLGAKRSCSSVPGTCWKQRGLVQYGDISSPLEKDVPHKRLPMAVVLHTRVHGDADSWKNCLGWRHTLQCWHPSFDLLRVKPVA
jgi:hypothetical protein